MGMKSYGKESTMIRSNYEVEVLINGKAAREYGHQGQAFIEGKKGTPFTIRIKNNGYQRILAVPTIDGLSVMDGKPASYDSPGYIISGYGSYTVDGWRVSDDKVNEFFFTDIEDSYASKKQEGQNVGVIGCAIFEEKERLPDIVYKFCNHNHGCHCQDSWYKHWDRTITTSTLSLNATNTSSFDVNNVQASSNVQSMANPQINMVKQDIGTGWGEERESRVTTVNFERKGSPQTVFELRYNTRKELERMGINFNERVAYIARAFPGQYCEPPRK